MKCPKCFGELDTGQRCYNPDCNLQGAVLVSSNPEYQHRERTPAPVANVFGDPLEQAIFCKEFLAIFQEIADSIKIMSARQR